MDHKNLENCIHKKLLKEMEIKYILNKSCCPYYNPKFKGVMVVSIH
jgi:hypothetical protein